jgi:hypothetical protein
MPHPISQLFQRIDLNIFALGIKTDYIHFRGIKHGSRTYVFVYINVTRHAQSECWLSLVPASCWFLASPWRWRRNVPPKYTLNFNGLYCALQSFGIYRLFLLNLLQTVTRYKVYFACALSNYSCGTTFIPHPLPTWPFLLLKYTNKNSVWVPCLSPCSTKLFIFRFITLWVYWLQSSPLCNFLDLRFSNYSSRTLQRSQFSGLPWRVVRRGAVSELHGFVSQNIVQFIATAMITSSPASDQSVTGSNY